MADEKVTKLEDRRKAAKAKLGEPKDADPRQQIRAYRAGRNFMGMPPCRGKPPIEIATGLPPHCPVRALGRDGDVFFFLNAAGGLGTLTPNSSGKGHIDALFAGAWNYLLWAWGRCRTATIEGREVTVDLENYDAEKVRMSLFEAATDKGAWNAVDMVRGRGAWIGPNDELILHLGGHLLVDGKEKVACGERDGFLYPQRPPLPGPDDDWHPEGPESPGARLLDVLESWNWSRSDIDPYLMLGWIGSAMFGGALSWRSTVFVTGDQSTGKSTLQKAVFAALGGSVVHCVDTTAAGIYQMLKQDTLPVTVDELESDSNNSSRKRAIIELARVANSGGRMLRGGQDHHGQQFDLRSPFLFSSINAPPLQPQDRSRMALLNLNELEVSEGREPIDLSEVMQWGRLIFRRLLVWWPKMGELRNHVAEWLMSEAGHKGRGADTFGTLVAFQHAILSDAMPTDEEMTVWCKRLHVSRLAEMESQTGNWKLCLRHLLQVRADALRSETEKTVGALLWRVFPDCDNTDGIADFDWLKRKLANVGLGLCGPKRGKLSHANAWLFVPNDHSSLGPLFEGTKWGGEGGAPGVWTDALRQSPAWNDDLKTGLYRQGLGRVSATPLRGTLLKLENLFDLVGDTAMQSESEDEDDQD